MRSQYHEVTLFVSPHGTVTSWYCDLMVLYPGVPARPSEVYVSITTPLGSRHLVVRNMKFDTPIVNRRPAYAGLRRSSSSEID